MKPSRGCARRGIRFICDAEVDTIAGTGDGYEIRWPPVDVTLGVRWLPDAAEHGNIKSSNGWSVMPHPYRNLPSRAFWRDAVSAMSGEAVDPVTDVPFRIALTDRVATAGSCFAQHISRTLSADGFRYHVTERAPPTANKEDIASYGVFPARFGNIYTVRQLLQLFQRAYGVFEPVDTVWRNPEGAWVDPFRPLIQARGFPSEKALLEDREIHLAAVREMFEASDVFVFTLGLTEGWRSKADGAVFPLAPGVRSTVERMDDYEFHNFEVAEMVEDLNKFIEYFRRLNPNVKILLTVSPVALVATYEPRHVLVSTIYSKSALRVVAEMISRRHEDVAYFPSYEIITGPQAQGRYFQPDMRGVTTEGVAHVMSMFRKHFLSQVQTDEAAQPAHRRSRSPSAPHGDPGNSSIEAASGVVCDEEALAD